MLKDGWGCIKFWPNPRSWVLYGLPGRRCAGLICTQQGEASRASPGSACQVQGLALPCFIPLLSRAGTLLAEVILSHKFLSDRGCKCSPFSECWNASFESSPSWWPEPPGTKIVPEPLCDAHSSAFIVKDSQDTACSPPPWPWRQLRVQVASPAVGTLHVCWPGTGVPVRKADTESEKVPACILAHRCPPFFSIPLLAPCRSVAASQPKGR